jgi:hypothetical protein
MSLIVMERTSDAPVSDEQIEGMKKAAEACLEINDVVRKHTYLSADRRRFVCVFEARDVESVRRSLESAGIPYEHIWPATVF